MNSLFIDIAKSKERITEFKRLKLCLRNVLTSSQYCAICLETDEVMFHIEDFLTISTWEGDYLTTMKSILNTIFIDKLETLIPSTTICGKCKTKAEDAYRFIQNTHRSAEILDDYLQQLDGRINDIHEMVDLSTPNSVQYANTVIVINDPPSGFNNEDLNKEIVSEGSYDYNSDNIELPCDKHVQSRIKYECDYCHKEFIAKHGLVYHIKVVHLNKTKYGIHLKKTGLKKEKEQPTKTRTVKYCCPECDQSPCKHEKYLHANKKQRLLGKKFIKCPDCNYETFKTSALIEHSNKVHIKEFKAILCEICGKPCLSKEAYYSHMRNCHTKLFNCEYCLKQLKDEKNFMSHLKDCKSIVREYQCNQCKASFDTRTKLDNHIRKHDQTFACRICNKVLSSETKVKTHEKMHANGGTIQFKCYTCNSYFSTRSERDDHNRSIHNLEGKSRCNECEMEFNSYTEHRWHCVTAKHMLNTNPDGRLKHKCDQCDYSTTSLESLKGHVNRYHLKIAPYPCPKCDKRFTVERKLKFHLLAHDKIKTRQCEYCGKYFSGQTAIKKHMRLHTGEKPYPCDVCGESFYSTSLRSIHRLKKHSVKTVRCPLPLCDAMFYTVAYMRCHFKKVHWKNKGEEFDIRKVQGLSEEAYELFRDKRLLVLK